jgi:predicted RNase H-like nuclease (RuvC/YqgF family)
MDELAYQRKIKALEDKIESLESELENYQAELESTKEEVEEKLEEIEKLEIDLGELDLKIEELKDGSMYLDRDLVLVLCANLLFSNKKTKSYKELVKSFIEANWSLCPESILFLSSSAKANFSYSIDFSKEKISFKDKLLFLLGKKD